MSTILYGVSLPATHETDARLYRIEQDANTENGATLKRGWPCFDATVIADVETTMRTKATYTNPKADNQTYSGTFVNSRVETDTPQGRPELDDRSRVLIQTLKMIVSPTTADGAGSTLGLNALKYIVNHVVKDSGANVDVTFLFKNINPSDEERASLMGITDAKLISTFGAGGTYYFVDREFQIQEDRTAWFSFTLKYVLTAGRGLPSGEYDNFDLKSVIFKTDDGHFGYGPYVQCDDLLVTPVLGAAKLFANYSSRMIKNGVAMGGYSMGIITRDNNTGNYHAHKIRLDHTTGGYPANVYTDATFDQNGGYEIRIY